ncbi:MAG: M17 family peptidase N-terminal domain-containing protein, partial [Gemmatimonadales bacterium]
MPFESTVSTAFPAGFATPLLAVPVPQGTVVPPSLGAVDGSTGGAVARLYSAGDFGGKRDEVAVLYPPGPAGRVLLVGLGTVDATSRPDLRRAAAVAAKRARTLG